MVFVHSIAMTCLMQFDFKNLVSYHHRIIEHFSITVYVNFAQTLGRFAHYGHRFDSKKLPEGLRQGKGGLVNDAWRFGLETCISMHFMYSIN